MNHQRRSVLRLGTVLSLAVAAGVLRPQQAWAVQKEWNKQAFGAKSVDEVLKSLGGTDAGTDGRISLVAPDIAENGAVVPVGVVSTLPGTTQIAILVPNNPSALVALFDLPQDAVPDIATRIKMGKTSDIYALVKADGKYYSAHKEVKVTLGGCGG